MLRTIEKCKLCRKFSTTGSRVLAEKSCEATCSADKKIEPPPTQENKMEKKANNLMSSLSSNANNAGSFLTKGPAMKQLALGAVSGWATGFMTIRVGKPAAFIVGSSVLAYQLAHSQGYVKADWKELKNKLEANPNIKNNGPKLLTKAQTFARGNTVFAAGFIGGFLIGLAS